MIVIDHLLLALQRQNLIGEDIESFGILLYEPKQRVRAIALAEKYRKQGENWQLVRKSSRKEISQYLAYGKRMHAKKLWYVEDEKEPREYALQ